MSIRFDHRLMQRDSANRGWSGSRLATRAKVSQMTVSRFFRGGTIRPETAKRLASALGQPVERYLLEDSATGPPVATEAVS